MITLEEARTGIFKRVVYHAAPGLPGEPGEITAVSKTLVFVRYDSGRQSKATSPADLDWLDENAEPEPEPTRRAPMESVRVLLNRELLIDAQRFAGAEEITFSGLVRLALHKYMEEA